MTATNESTAAVATPQLIGSTNVLVRLPSMPVCKPRGFTFPSNFSPQENSPYLSSTSLLGVSIRSGQLGAIHTAIYVDSCRYSSITRGSEHSAWSAILSVLAWRTPSFAAALVSPAVRIQYSSSVSDESARIPRSCLVLRGPRPQMRRSDCGISPLGFLGVSRTLSRKSIACPLKRWLSSSLEVYCEDHTAEDSSRPTQGAT